MAQITWRDVAAPDFSGAISGIGQFSRLFGDSLGSLKSAVGGFDQAKSDLVNNQLALALAQQPDAAAAKAAIASGRLGSLDLSDPSFLRRISPASLAAISPDALTKLGLDQTRLSTNKLTLGQDQINAEQRSARDASAAQLDAADAAFRAGNNAEGERLLASIDKSKFGYGAVGDLNKSVLDTGRDATSNDQARFNLGNQKEDKADKDAADAAQSIFRSSTLNGDDARLLLNDPKGPAAKLSVGARAILESRLASQYPDLFGSATGASAAIAGAAGGAPVSGVAGGSADSPYDIVIGGPALGLQPNKPVSQMTLAEAEAYGKNVLIPKTKGNKQLGLGDNQGSSAIGAYQILAGSTLGDYAKKLGLDMNTTKFDPDTQERIAKAIFEDNKGGNLKAIWTSLPDARPGAYKNLSWEQVRGQIAKGESGASAAQLLLDSRNAQAQIASRSMQDSAHGLDIDFASTIADNRDVGQVADGLRQGIFKGTSRAFLLNQLTKIMNEGHVNAATAAAILNRNIDGSDHDFWSPRQLIRQLTPGSTPNLGNGARLNDKGIKEDTKLLRNLKQQDILAQVSARDSRTLLSAQIQAAQQELAAAQQQYTAALTRSVTQPGLKAVLPRYEAQLQAAKAKVLLFQQQSQATSNQPG